MGAPGGHPFFGNQYTNGGYVTGSYTYEVAVDALGNAARAVGDAANSMLSQNSRVLAKFSPGALGLPRGSLFSIQMLIAAGAVALIGGVTTFAYLRNRSTGAVDETLNDENIAVFGLCESCGQALATTGPAKLQKDEDGNFVKCENCEYPNRGRYSEDED